METSTSIYPVNRLEDLKLLPEWVIDSLAHPATIISDLSWLKEKTTQFASEIFEEEYDFDQKIEDLDPYEIKDILYINSEQRNYLYRMVYNTTKEELYERLYRNYKDNYIREYGCEIWFIISKINDQPFGGVFVFHQPNSKEIMIQGISKFIVPTVLSMIDPVLMSKLPRLNSLVMPSIETIAKMIGAQRVVVNPIGKQGDILIKHYGFYPIEPREKICSLTSITVKDNWLAKDFDY